MTIDRIDWHWDSITEDIPEKEHLERAGAHIGYYIEWAYKKGFAPNNTETHDVEEYQKVADSKVTGINFLISNCDTKFWDCDINAEGLEFTKYIYDKYLEDYEKVVQHKPYTEKYNKKDLEKVSKYLDDKYSEYKKLIMFIPKNEEELIKKMEECNFHGKYYLKKGIIYWEKNNKKAIQIIVYNQGNESYISLPNGSHDHIQVAELFKYLIELNNSDESESEIYNNHPKGEKIGNIFTIGDKIGDIFTMFILNILVIGSWGAFIGDMKNGNFEIGLIFLAILLSIIDILLITHFYQQHKSK